MNSDLVYRWTCCHITWLAGWLRNLLVARRGAHNGRTGNQSTFLILSLLTLLLDFVLFVILCAPLCSPPGDIGQVPPRISKRPTHPICSLNKNQGVPAQRIVVWLWVRIVTVPSSPLFVVLFLILTPIFFPLICVRFAHLFLCYQLIFWFIWLVHLLWLLYLLKLRQVMILNLIRCLLLLVEVVLVDLVRFCVVAVFVAVFAQLIFIYLGLRIFLVSF